jgi:hypothetical protein
LTSANTKAVAQFLRNSDLALLSDNCLHT